MGYAVGYSSLTMFLYIIIGIFCSIWLKNTYESKNKIINTSLNARLLILWTFLTLFAAFRLVNANNVGGTDAYNYELAFVDRYYAARYLETDKLFGLYIQTIRCLTSNIIIYRIISYGLISGAYILIIKKICNNKISFIPFILLIFPYLRSFNTMRNSIAIAIVIIGILLLYDKKNIFGIICLISSIFFHRMSVIYAMFIPFYFIFSGYDFSNRKKLFRFIIFWGTIAFLLSKQIQSFILASQVLTSENGGADIYYIGRTLNQGVFSYFPMLFQHIILFIFLIIYNDRLPNKPDVQFLKILIIYDLIIMPPSLVFGMWRSVEYIYIFRLVLWGYLIKCIEFKLSLNSKKLISIALTCVFIFWLYFRIDHEWKDAGLMPYIPFFLS